MPGQIRKNTDVWLILSVGIAQRQLSACLAGPTPTNHVAALGTSGLRAMRYTPRQLFGGRLVDLIEKRSELGSFAPRVRPRPGRQELRIVSRPYQRGYADVMEAREFPPARIEDIAHRHGAVEVRVFGSWLRKASGGPRDLDLLVRFEPGRDLLDLVALKQEVEEAVGIPVDVVTEEGLSPYLRDTILAEARPLGRSSNCGGRPSLPAAYSRRD